MTRAVQIQAVIGIKHGGNQAVALLVHDVPAGYVALAGGAQNGASLGEDAGKILRFHIFIVALNQPPVTVIHAENLNIVQPLEQGLAHAPDGRVEPWQSPPLVISATRVILFKARASFPPPIQQQFTLSGIQQEIASANIHNRHN